MARQVKNVLVGVGTLKVSAQLDANGNPVPNNDGIGDATTGEPVDIGFTMDGVEITLEPDIVDIVVDQLGDAAKLIEQSIKVMVKTTLAEATLANLAIAWGRADAAYDLATKTLEIGVNETGKPVERKLIFEGKSPDNTARTYTVNRAVSVAASGHSFKRGEATVFPVEFRILPDASQTGAEYGTIVDS